MLGETEQAVKRTKVEALPTDPSVMREWLLMMRDNMSEEDLTFCESLVFRKKVVGPMEVLRSWV